MKFSFLKLRGGAFVDEGMHLGAQGCSRTLKTPNSPPLKESLSVLPFLQVMHPKSDVQRARLAESVRNIFLFRSLDPVSAQSIFSHHLITGTRHITFLFCVHKGCYFILSRCSCKTHAYV